MIFTDFSIPKVIFHDFPDLENFYFKFHDLPDFSKTCTNPEHTHCRGVWLSPTYNCSVVEYHALCGLRLTVTITLR